VPEGRYRVLYVLGHPVQYFVPVLRLLGRHPQLDVTSAYCRMHGAKAAHDPEFGATIQWDVPVLDGYSWIEVPNKGTDSEGFWGLYNPGLWKLVREGNFDAVVCITGYIRASFWITYFASKLSRSAFLFGTDTTTLRPRDRSRWKAPVKRLFWPLLYRLATQVVAPSSGTRALMLSLGIRDERITMVPSVVDNDWWTAQSAKVDRAAVRASWGAGPNTSVILFCGKLVSWKRPADLLHAFAQANLPDSLLVFTGQGARREYLEQESLRLNISDRVRFLGFANQSQLPAIYTAADLHVLPSEYEPFGMVVNEAMLCGCVTAASDQVGAITDLVQPVSPSLIYKCSDVSALSPLLTRTLSDRPALDSLRAKARQRMESWSPREYVSSILAGIARASSRKGRSR